MATTAYLAYQDGKLEVPEELRAEWQLHNGDYVEISRVHGKGSPLLSKLSQNPKEIDWRQFEGVLGDSDIDLNAELEKERIRENG